MAISIPQSSYGQPVLATASVSATPGPAEGDVVFSVDGLATKTNLGASGTATLVLPAAAVGEHAVTATFVPQFPTSQQGSSSPSLSWVVAPARTRTQVRVIGRGARIPTSVQVKAAGEFGTTPTGRVSWSCAASAPAAARGSSCRSTAQEWRSPGSAGWPRAATG